MEQASLSPLIVDALTEALEGLGRLRRCHGGVTDILMFGDAHRSVGIVQAALVAAIKNLVDDKIYPTSQEEAKIIIIAMQQALRDFGGVDESVRAGAARVCGMVGIHLNPSTCGNQATDLAR